MFLLWERTKSKDRNPERKVVTLENTAWKVIYKTEMYKKHIPPVSTKNIQSHIHLNKYCQATYHDNATQGSAEKGQRAELALQTVKGERD